MQTNITTKEKKFEPIEVTFVIESKRELEGMLSLFNANGSDRVKFMNEHLPQVRNIIESFELHEIEFMSHAKWKELYTIYETL